MAKPQTADDLIDELDPPAEEPELATDSHTQADMERAAGVVDVPASNLKDPTMRAVEASVRAKAKPVVFDDVSGVLTVTDQHGTFETSLMGINPRVEWQLAAIGLASLLKGRIDKDKVIENIKAGQFGGKRRQKYPATVIAYANYQNITVEEAWTQWQSLSVPERMQVRSMPKVRLELAKLADAAEAKP
jgi:hypothetical protein